MLGHLKVKETENNLWPFYSKGFIQNNIWCMLMNYIGHAVYNLDIKPSTWYIN